MSNHTFLKDSVWAVVSQAISMLTGIVMSLILPKIMPIEEFGYWQLFLLYASYVGITHLGTGDGLYLKWGGKYFEDLNRRELYPQIQLISIVQIGFAVVCFIGSFILFSNDRYRLFIFLALALFIVIENIYKILCFVLMATDKMVFNSKTVIIDKTLLLLSVLIFLLFSNNLNTIYVISAYVISHLVVMVMVLLQFRGIFKISAVFSLNNIKSVVALAVVGFVLTISNLMSTLIVGSCRMIVERFWDIKVFAQLSLAITISVFVLTFVSQISYVLFPYLRRMSAENQSKVLRDSAMVMTIFSPYLYCFVFPLYYFILLWLPQYCEAAHFMTLIAPMCLFEIRGSLLYNTYFKNLNKIKPLLYVNIITVVIAVALYAISVYYHNMDMMSISILVSIILKNCIMQRYLYKYYDLRTDIVFLFDLFFVVLMTCLFLSSSLETVFIVYLLYVFFYSVLVIVFKKQLLRRIIRFAKEGKL